MKLAKYGVTLACLLWPLPACVAIAAPTASSVTAERTVVVAADGGGDFETVQAAVNAAPDDKTRRLIIRIRPGIYKEKITISATKGPLTFLGDSAATTILTYDDFAGRMNAAGNAMGTSASYSVKIEADDFTAENLTFENTHPVGGGTGNQALALSCRGDRAVFRNCRFLGRQDTVYLAANRQYFEDCYIAGQVDYIFGAATAWFERCELRCVAPGISITAASTPPEQPYGFVFSRCNITAEPPANWKTHLGRPWRPYAGVTYLDTEMADIIAPAGWDNWGKVENETTARFAEYNSRTPDGRPIDLAPRVPWAMRLTAAEAAAITPEAVLGGWNPASSREPSQQPSTAATLTVERIAALPPQQRAAWHQYLNRSTTRLTADKAALAAEMQAHHAAKPIAAPEGPTFKLDSSTPATWYASAEARLIADAVVSFQTPAGGWSKAVAFDKGPRRPGMHWTTNSGGWSYVGTFDNRATTEQLALLAKVHQATGDRKYSEAFLKGLDYIFDAQYPNGGWPQVYPLAGDYHDAVTFNDDMMVHILELLRDVASGRPEFAFVDDARRAQARDTVAAGVRIILQAQVVQHGQRTVWAAQYDPLTLAPAAARKYEPASLTAGESVGIVRFLMGIESPDADVIQAVESAVAWYKSAQITGIEVVKQPQPDLPRGFDTIVVANPVAPPIWARFYELGTNRPIFIGRDAIIKYNLAEIEAERRTGYAWYVTSPRSLLAKDYPAWRAR